MLDYIKERFTEVSTWKGIAALVAAIVMYFTPDDIDRIIMFIMTAFGITEILTIEKK